MSVEMAEACPTSEHQDQSPGARQAAVPANEVSLGKHQLSAIVNELADVATKWVLLGTCLGVDHSEIDEIEKLNLPPKESLLKLMSRWLDTTNLLGASGGDSAQRTWRDITTALRLPMLKEERVAEQIEMNINSRLRSRSLIAQTQRGSERFSRSESLPADVLDGRSCSPHVAQLETPNAVHVQFGVSVQSPSSSGPPQPRPLAHQLSSTTRATTSVATQTTDTDHSNAPVHVDSSLPSGVISPGNNNGQSQPSRPEELELDNCAKSKHNCESLPIEMFVQDCMSSLPKLSSGGKPSPIGLVTTSTKPSSTPSGSASTLSAQEIQLECEVYNGKTGRQIHCSKVAKKELSEVYRDIKLKVKKFDTIPPCSPIYFRVRASEPCYVYIINKGSSGTLTTLIPNECDENNRLTSPEQFIQFPSVGADYEFELDQNCGTETIVVLAYSANAVCDTKQAERDCKRILSGDTEKDHSEVLSRDIKLVKKHSNASQCASACRGCIEIQFTVK